MTPDEREQRKEWLATLLPEGTYDMDAIAGSVVVVPPGGLPDDHPLAGSYLDVPPDIPDLSNPRHPLNEPPVNRDDRGVAHFCVIPPGSEADFCGGCGNPWPCDDAVRLQAYGMPEAE